MGKALFWMVLVIGAALLGGCDEDDCTYGDFHCEDGVAYRCAGVETMLDSRTIWQPTDCGAADLCQTDDQAAFCVLSAQPDPRCTASTLCEADTLLGCRSGFLLSRTPCLACDPDDPETCIGGLGLPCDSNGQCTSGLECRYGDCSLRCECPADEPCPVCDPYAQHAARQPHCVAGWCTYLW